MANRNLNFNQQVTDVVPEKPDDLEVQIAGVAAELADASVKSKILDATSQAQVGFKQLDAQYRIKYEGDPNNEEGLKELSEARQLLTEKLGSNISTLYSRQWSDATGKLAGASDASNGIWAIEQNHRNVKENVNSSLKNYLEMASADGQAFGASANTDASALLNYATAHDALLKFGNEALGSETTGKLLDSFSEDYLKSAISGVAITNPVKAAKMLDDPMVVEKLGAQPEQFMRFRSAIENRAKHFQKNQEQKQVINGMRDDAAPLAQGGTMSYAKFASLPLSETAREYYAGVNGFDVGHGKRGGLTPEDKANYRLAILENVQKLTKDEGMDAGSVRVVQDAIFKAMNKGAITQKEGMGYLSQIVEPLNTKKEETMKQYGTGALYNFFNDDIGFGGIQEYYDKNVAHDTTDLPAAAKRDAEVRNQINKSNLYDYYSGALGAEAQKRGVTVADLQNLPAPERKRVYAQAQTEAQKLFIQDKHPALRTMPDVPNLVYGEDGKLTQGLAGPRNVKSTGSATPTFRIQKNKKTGETRRVYPDGRKELIK